MDEQKNSQEIKIRTMEGDIKALQEGGGELPENEKSKFVLKTPAQPQAPDIGIGGYSGPEKAMFSGQASASGGKNIFKAAILSGIILIAILGLGLLGYYVIAPLILK